MTRPLRIALATLVAAATATAVDLGIESIARRAFDVSADFEPFQGTVAPYTVGGVLLAGIAYAVVRRVAHDPRRAYVRLAAAALVLSWVPDIGLLVVNDLGATVPAVGSLMVMHAAAAAITVAALLWADGQGP